MTENERLAHSLRMQFGLPPGQPSDSQLVNIKAAIKRIRDQGQTPNRSDWERAVNEYCPGAGSWSYSGIDNSDLNTLLALAIANAKRG
nr:hypothetical protein [uncultured Pseudomonas sp.]